MTNLRSLMIAGIFAAAAAALPGTASAASGHATGSVNLRTGPGTQYSRILAIPAGAALDIYRCASWCNVNYRGHVGWVSARYVSSGAYYRPPTTVFRQLPPRSGYIARPRWDDRYGAWYDGRRWYRDGRWYDRPNFSFFFGFGR